MLAGKQLKEYLIEKEIGSGAMGTVYRAKNTETGDRVAFKFISSGLDGSPKALARFEREMAILKALRHPNIVRLLKSGHLSGKPFYVMEYIEGETLERMLRRRGRMEWEEVVRVGQQICAALQHAHDQGVIHRDLKPANIMLAADGTVKLTDFGIAKGFDQQQLTATNCAVGTASYMSPEQCKGERNLSHKSDLYSLGVLLYEMLVGRRPFQAETTLDMYLAHVEGKFERPSREVLDIPIWLDTLICQLLEKDPNKRPFDAATVARALGETMEKVQARLSAGVDVATGRTAASRPKSDNPRDEADREAARVLRAAAGKRRRKKGGLSKKMIWFQAVGYSVGLVILAGMVWWFLQPPPADDLYARAEKMMQSANFDDHEKARKDPINDYLKYYGARADKQTEQVQKWADDVDAAQRDRRLRSWMKRGWEPESDAEKLAWAAARREDEGDFPAAVREWQALAKLKDEKDGDRRAWGQLAERRLRALEEVNAEEQRLIDLVNGLRDGLQVKFKSELERLPVRAIHFQVFGDLGSARTAWARVKDTAQSDLDRRAWFLIAARRLNELKTSEKEEKVKPEEVVQKQLERVPELRKDARTLLQARKLCRDVILLYGRDQALAKEVAQAEKVLQEMAVK
jgi:serine/threonine-protein kinase